MYIYFPIIESTSRDRLNEYLYDIALLTRILYYFSSKKPIFLRLSIRIFTVRGNARASKCKINAQYNLESMIQT